MVLKHEIKGESLAWGLAHSGQAIHTVVFSLIYLLPAHILSQDAKGE